MADAASVVLVDSDPVFRATIARALKRAGFGVHEAAAGEDALSLALRPAAVVVDVALPDIDGFEVCHELRALYGDDLPLIIVSTRRVTTHDRIAALLIGADEYLQKPVDAVELVARLRRLTRRAATTNGAGANGDRNGLSPREFEVLGLLAAGLNAQAIADRLVISQKTVSSHLQRVMTKLGVHSRAQAVGEAYRRGLVDVDFEGHALVATGPERLA